MSPWCWEHQDPKEGSSQRQRVMAKCCRGDQTRVSENILPGTGSCKAFSWAPTPCARGGAGFPYLGSLRSSAHPQPGSYQARGVTHCGKCDSLGPKKRGAAPGLLLESGQDLERGFSFGFGEAELNELRPPPKLEEWQGTACQRQRNPNSRNVSKSLRKVSAASFFVVVAFFVFFFVVFFCFVLFLFFCFLRPHQWYMEVPRWGSNRS